MWESKKKVGLQLLGYYGYEGGYPPGGFLESLLTTWGKADTSNKIRLSIGFPMLSGLLAKFQEMDPEDFRTWLETVEEED